MKLSHFSQCREPAATLLSVICQRRHRHQTDDWDWTALDKAVEIVRGNTGLPWFAGDIDLDQDLRSFGPMAFQLSENRVGRDGMD